MVIFEFLRAQGRRASASPDLQARDAAARSAKRDEENTSATPNCVFELIYMTVIYHSLSEQQQQQQQQHCKPMPKLHRVKLPKSEKANFRYEWRVVGGGGDDDHNNNNNVLQPGDMILDASLLTGAGEFEGCRIVTEDSVLSFMGIEYAEFPQAIVDRYGGAANLKALYEPLIEDMLREQGLSFADLSGGPEGAAEFWSNIERYSITKADRKTDGVWEIPFEQIEFLSSSSSSSS